MRTASRKRLEMNDFQLRNSLGGRLAQARQRGDKELELRTEQELAELRIKMMIDEQLGNITIEAAERLCGMLTTVAVAA